MQESDNNFTIFFLTEGKHQQICQGCKRVMPTVENREIMPGNLE